MGGLVRGGWIGADTVVVVVGKALGREAGVYSVVWSAMAVGADAEEVECQALCSQRSRLKRSHL